MVVSRFYHRIKHLQIGADDATVKKRIADLQPWIKQIFANHRINFNLEYAYSDESSLKDGPATVHIYDILTTGNNSQKWGNLVSHGSQDNVYYTSTMITHEILNLLGLSDRYADPQCPQRSLGNRNEIMTQGGNLLIADAKINDSEIQKIIAPLFPAKGKMKD